MAVDFMEHPARFLNSLLFILLFTQCHQTEQQELVHVNAASSSLQTKRGITRVNNEPFTGTVYALYSGSMDTMFQQSYRQGLEDGAWKQFYPNHQLKEIRYFANGQKTDSCLAWWENGKRSLSAYFVNGEYEGVYREWSPQGLLLKEMTYQAGHEEGSQRAWYDNGKIKSNYVIRKGRRYGLLGTKNCKNVSERLFEK